MKRSQRKLPKKEKQRSQIMLKGRLNNWSYCSFKIFVRFYQILKAIRQQAIRFLFDQTINPVDVLRLGVSTIRLFYNQIFNLLYNYIFLLYASNSFIYLGWSHMGLGVPFLLSLLGIFLNICNHFPCQMYLYYLYSIQCARLYYTVNE